MAFQNQFTLSLELTNLVPAGFAVAGKTWDAAMRLARQLQSSRSDIVIEEDLALMFGRCRIAENLARSFRTIVTAQAKAEPLPILEAGIALISGPGPSVVRALTETHGGPYFAMVVQCSLLVTVHERRPLAAALAQAFEKESLSAPETFQARSTPSAEGIEGVLQAIEDQTSSFVWRHLLYAVAGQLGLPDKDIHATISTTILQALITMLPSVQRFPDDRMVIVEVSYGSAVLTVWAHHIFGLSTLVRIHEDGETIEARFGDAPEQVLIDVRRHLEQSGPSGEPVMREHSVTLLSTKDGDKLTLKAEPDDEYIDGTLRGPLRGYAKRLFNRNKLNTQHPNLTKELALVTTAFSALYSQHLQVAAVNESPGAFRDRWSGNHSEESSEPADGSGTRNTLNDLTFVEDVQSEPQTIMPVDVPIDNLLMAARMLFDDPKLKSNQVQTYVDIFQNQPLNSIRIPLGTISAILNTLSTSERDSWWSFVRLTTIMMSVMTFAFAHVPKLEKCSDLPLYEDHSVLGESTLSMKLLNWDGHSDIRIEAETSFEAICCLMLGQSSSLDLSQAALLSHKGWSVFLSSFGDADPGQKEKGCVFIQKGVPCRNNVWKHMIIDASSPTRSHQTWHIQNHSGSEMRLLCHSRMRFGKAFCGERGDAFVLSLRLHDTDATGAVIADSVRRSGYNELYNALWRSVRTSPCPHGSTASKTMTLPPGCVAFSGFGDHGISLQGAGPEFQARIHICLTAGNRAARWRALTAIAATQEAADKFVPVLLRAANCCLTCAVEQALVKEGVWFLVL